MTSLGAPVKNGPEVMALLNALQLPGHIAILKMKSHGQIFTDESKGNGLADRTAKAAAKRRPLSPELIRKHMHCLRYYVVYGQHITKPHG